jgi:hypothetical protein
MRKQAGKAPVLDKQEAVSAQDDQPASNATALQSLGTK